MDNFKQFLNTLKSSNQSLIESVEKAFEILFENELKDKYLFHATYKQLLNKIKEEGLDTKKGKQYWEDSVPGYVYLANDKDIAISYAESSDMVPEYYLDNIIVLTIDTSLLDEHKLFKDQNVKNDTNTFEYRGVIPYSAVMNIENSDDAETIFESSNQYAKVVSISDDGEVVIDISGKIYKYRGLDAALAKARYKQLEKKPFKYLNWVKENYQLIKTSASDKWFTKEEFENK